MHNPTALINVPMVFDNVMVWKKLGEKPFEGEDEFQSSTGGDNKDGYVLCSLPRDEWEGIKMRELEKRAEDQIHPTTVAGLLSKPDKEKVGVSVSRSTSEWYPSDLHSRSLRWQ